MLVSCRRTFTERLHYSEWRAPASVNLDKTVFSFLLLVPHSKRGLEALHSDRRQYCTQKDHIYTGPCVVVCLDTILHHELIQIQLSNPALPRHVALNIAHKDITFLKGMAYIECQTRPLGGKLRRDSTTPAFKTGAQQRHSRRPPLRGARVQWHPAGPDAFRAVVGDTYMLIKPGHKQPCDRAGIESVGKYNGEQ
ncbi:hypothetical protein B0H14DRAFT_2702827 [Mycena olivaceomarginata]|nr:hypothetical protein B0H14DRAFT_2702827 [Mycena olivaceomarginata]